MAHLPLPAWQGQSFCCRALSPGRIHYRLGLLLLSLLAAAPPAWSQAGLGELCAKALCESRETGISSEAIGTEVVASFARPAEAPETRLLLAADGLFYGTTELGGDFDLGAIYRISASGEYERLHSFAGTYGAFGASALIQDADGNLYGTSGAGGFSGVGTVFRRTPDGTMSLLREFEFDDGSEPVAALALGSDGLLYGTTRGGGNNDLGTVFAISPDGQQFTTLHHFDGAMGALPVTPLTEADDGNFYGTTEVGGPDDLGTIFRITPAGEFTLLHAFSGPDGQIPSGGLVPGSDAALYGLTSNGGPNSNEFNGGVMYRLTTGGEFSVLHGFPSRASEGTFPVGELVLASDGNFYGMTKLGGADFSGTVFRVAQDGSNLQTVLAFTSGVHANPDAGLAADGNGTLYGTTLFGGRIRDGSVFALAPDGSVDTLHSFGSVSGHRPTGLTPGDGVVLGSTKQGGTNSEGTLFSVADTGSLQTLHDFGEIGFGPAAPPILGSDGRLYGTTEQGGEDHFLGIIYRLEADGDLSLLHEFSGADGEFPQAQLFQASDGSFYGSAVEGGANSHGSLFRITGMGSFELLHAFNGADGRAPFPPPIEASDGNFYGTTESGGSSDAGVLYRMTPTGQYSVLHHFVFATGYYPEAGLVEAEDGMLYGTTTQGGDEGALFRFDFADGDYELLHAFVGPDGSDPATPLLPIGNGEFYGSTQTGGEFGLGTVFKLTTVGGVAVETLHQFGGADGAFPRGPLAVLGDVLYVSTAHFGPNGGGTVLRIAPQNDTSEQDDSSGGGGGSGAAMPWMLLLIALLTARRRAALPRDCHSR